MNESDDFLKTLRDAKIKLVENIKRDQAALEAIDTLLLKYHGFKTVNVANGRKPTSTGVNRRRGLALETLNAVKSLKRCSINDVVQYIIQTNPVGDNTTLLPKVSTHLKRLCNYGEIECEKKQGSPKVYYYNQELTPIQATNQQ